MITNYHQFSCEVKEEGKIYSYLENSCHPDMVPEWLRGCT